MALDLRLSLQKSDNKVYAKVTNAYDPKPIKNWPIIDKDITLKYAPIKEPILRKDLPMIPVELTKADAT